MARRRLFFALWPDEATAEAVDRARRRHVTRDGRWVPRSNLHLTVLFLGDIRDDLAVEEWPEALDASSMTLVLDHLGTFRRSGLQWLGASMLPPALSHLVESLRARAAARGIPVETRPFHAHITLARRVRQPGEGRLETPIPWRIDRLYLIESRLTSTGPHYSPVGHWGLGDTPPL